MIDTEYEREWRQLESNDTTLTELDLFGHRIPRGNWGKLGILIGRNTHLKSFALDNCSYNMTKEDFEKLFHGIACNESIGRLRFDGCNVFDGEVFRLLIPMFKRNNDGNRLDIYNCELRPICVQSLATAVSEFHSLKEFKLSSCSINDDAALLQLIRSLGGHPGLESLYFDGISTSINIQGAALSKLLQNPTSNLTTLELTDTTINPEGWQAIFVSLETPVCRLQKLALNYSNIDNDAALSLSSSLVNNSSLKELIFNGMVKVTDRGWQGFTAVLASPHSALLNIDLCCNFISDATKILLVNALAGNTKLEVFQIALRNRDISPEVMAAASHILCNTSSIMHTYSSNHTLNSILDDDHDEYDDDECASGIMPLLVINRMCSSSQAAHVKIITKHFSGDFDAQMFGRMNLNVLPHTIAWVGRHWDNDEVNGVYAHLARIERDFQARENSEPDQDMEESDSDGFEEESEDGDDDDSENEHFDEVTSEMSLLYQILQTRASDIFGLY